MDRIPKIVVEPPGPIAQSKIDMENSYLSQAFAKPTPIVWDHAEDCVITDVDGNQYIDFSSGVQVTNVGHCPPQVIGAVKQQMDKITNCFTASHSLRGNFLESLVDLLPSKLSKVIPETTGAEAMEIAVKMAREYTGKYEIISFNKAFHGKTYMSMAISGSTDMRRKYGPLPTGVIHGYAPYCYRCLFDKTYPECGVWCFDYLEHVLEVESCGSLAAAIVEPFQSWGAPVGAMREFLHKLKKFCENNNILLIFDEVKTGFGRTGKMFCFEHFDIIPDIIAIGKGMASGFPISALVTTEEISDRLSPGSLNSTFSANPLSCAATIATIEMMVEQDLPRNAARVGSLIEEKLHDMKDKHDRLGDFCGLGLLIAVEVVKDKKSKTPAPEEARSIVEQSIKNGLYIVPTFGTYHNMIRISPPLTISEEMATVGMDILDKAFSLV
jgi:4-aminobutyrate aminotransferase-like enzyme